MPPLLRVGIKVMASNAAQPIFYTFLLYHPHQEGRGGGGGRNPRPTANIPHKHVACFYRIKHITWVQFYPEKGSMNDAASSSNPKCNHLMKGETLFVRA